jgi:hypothetical protein
MAICTFLSKHTIHKLAYLFQEGGVKKTVVVVQHKGWHADQSVCPQAEALVELWEEMIKNSACCAIVCQYLFL